MYEKTIKEKRKAKKAILFSFYARKKLKKIHPT